MIITLHAFVRGTGKSSIAANIAMLLAQQGKRVAVVDMDLTLPGMHLLFEGVQIGQRCVNSYLLNQATLSEVVQPIAVPSASSEAHSSEARGKLWLVAASSDPSMIRATTRQGYSAERLQQFFEQLLQHYQLDVIMLDAQEGLSEINLPAIALSDTLLTVMKLERPNYLGTGVALEVARRLEVPTIRLLVNSAHPSYDHALIRQEVAEKYRCQVLGILPYDEAMTTLDNHVLFVLRYPEHPFSDKLRALAAALTA